MDVCVYMHGYVCVDVHVCTFLPSGVTFLAGGGKTNRGRDVIN